MANCDICGEPHDLNNPGQSTADTVLCAGCTREAAKWTDDGNPHEPEPIPSADLVKLPPGLHMRHGRIIGVPEDYSKDVLFMSIVNDPNDFSPAVDLVKPDHVAHGPPVDDEEEPEDDFDNDSMTPLDDEERKEYGDPGATLDCDLCGEPLGLNDLAGSHAACMDRENADADREYIDPAPPLNAADITAEIRRMS